MLTENTRAIPGNNNPPSPIELVASQYDAVISEAQNWADGEPVTDEAGLTALDAVIKEFRTYKTTVGKAGKEMTDPLHKEWKAEVARVKVYTDDAQAVLDCLIQCGAPYRNKLAAEKKEAERAAWQAACDAEREAAELVAKANAGNIEDQRAAQQAQADALEASKAASTASKDKVKGFRTVTTPVIDDAKAVVNWIAINDRNAMLAFIEEYVRRNGKAGHINGTSVKTEKVPA